MKTTVKVLFALALAAGVAQAAPETKKDDQASASKESKAKSSVARTEKGKLRPQTGSRVQRTVDLSGRITDGPYQVVIISGDTIRRSGYSTVSQVLASQGFRR